MHPAGHATRPASQTHHHTGSMPKTEEPTIAPKQSSFAQHDSNIKVIEKMVKAIKFMEKSLAQTEETAQKLGLPPQVRKFDPTTEFKQDLSLPFAELQKQAQDHRKLLLEKMEKMARDHIQRSQEVIKEAELQVKAKKLMAAALMLADGTPRSHTLLIRRLRLRVFL